MPTMTHRQPLRSSGMLVSLCLAAWCAACAAPSPTTGDPVSRFATRTTAAPSGYPVALPSNWESYKSASPAPSSAPAGWPPANLGSLPVSWPQGYSPGTATPAGPVSPTQVGPSSWSGYTQTPLPGAAASAIPSGINVGGQGPDVVGDLFGSPSSSDVVQPDNSLGFSSNQATPYVGGMSYQGSSGWHN